MPASLTKGQKTDITKNNPAIGQLVIGMGWATGSEIDVDFSAFLLRSDGKVSGDSDLIFYGNPKSVDGSIAIAGEGKRSFGGAVDREQVTVALKAVPAGVERISFALTIYEGEQRKQNFSRVDDAYIRVADASSGLELLRYDIGKNFSVETAIVVGELYRYNGEWKFSAIGSGYSGGLAALCRSFGIETQEDASPAPAPSPPPAPASGPPAAAPPPPQQQAPPAPSPAPASKVSPSAPSPTPASPPVNAAPIRLSKISLYKRGDVINLQKGAGALGEIVVNLNWNRQKSSGGGFLKRLGGGNGGVDLDLACLFELKDGSKSVVQALGNTFGSFDRAPYIALDGDDRTGSIATGENLRINGNKIAQIKRILVFAFIYQGVANWAQADGVVTIKQAGGPDIEVRMDEHDNRKRMCAIAMIENVNDQTFSIKRLVEYYSGHREIDKAYGWGLRWQAGSK